MEKDKVLQMPLAKIYPLLVQKAECKGRTRGEVDEPMRTIRCLDKMVDELAKGKPMEKILRKS